MGGLLLVYLAFPVAAFLYRVVGSHDRGFGAAGLWAALSVSLQGATISLVLITALGVPLAYALARHPGRLSTAVSVVVQLPLALPPLMSGILLIYVVGPYSFLGRHSGGRLTETLTGVVIAQSFVSAPFLVVSARSAFSAVDPALGDVAATLGHRPLARFFRVDVPGAAAGIRAGMVLTWLRAFGEYGATLIIAYHPFSLPIYLDNQFSGYPLSTTEAPTLIAIVVAALAVAAGGVPLRRRSRPVVLPEPRPPAGRPATPVDFDLDLRVGTFHLAVRHTGPSHRLAVVGPSGSGKSITLRALAGLLGPDAGTVRYGGVDVTRIATERRRIGYVPQGLGLLPGRTVWQQVNFGVGADPALASWWLRTLHLDGLADRRPEELSGGQRQRVSLARAMAVAPDILLLDEPFSALDAPVRAELRLELRRLQQQTGLSTVLVTHDPEEAAVLADELVVVTAGAVLQSGPVPDVFRHPATVDVGRLLGVPNIRVGTIGPDGTLRSGALHLAAGVALPAGTAVLWRVSPLRVTVGVGAGGGAEVGAGVEVEAGVDAAGDDLPAATRAGRAFDADVVDVIDLGTAVEISVVVDGGPGLVARSDAAVGLAPGGRCRVTLDPADVTVWARPPTRDEAAPWTRIP